MLETRTQIEDYIREIPEEKKEPFLHLYETIKSHLPHGFIENFSHGMIGFVVPLSVYPKGYHVDGTALPFIHIAAQKNHIALYHMGLYMDLGLQSWFTDQYEKRVPNKLDMGKSCIRFKNPKKIPYDLIGELVEKMDLPTYVNIYEKTQKKSQG